MSAESAIHPRAKRAIRAALKRLGDRSLSRDELDQVTSEIRADWGLQSLSVQQFANELVRAKVLATIRLEFPSRNNIRYLHGNPSPYEVAQSINRQGYLSHFTAIHLHQLTDQLPKIVYLNVEQHLSPGGGELHQEAIDRTFKRPCRITHNIAEYKDRKITVLNGGNTGCLGVEPLETSNAPDLRITGIERTLIDAAVRPIYSGGVFEVAKAYRAAKGRVSVALLTEMLSRLNYTYPYHQSIGYLLERAGFESSEVAPLSDFPMKFDFYLDYALRQTEFNSRWRLFIPKGF